MDTSHPSNIETCNPPGLWLIHLNDIDQTNSGSLKLCPTQFKFINLRDVYYFKVIMLYGYEGTLVWDSFLSIKLCFQKCSLSLLISTVARFVDFIQTVLSSHEVCNQNKSCNKRRAMPYKVHKWLRRGLLCTVNTKFINDFKVI